MSLCEKKKIMSVFRKRLLTQCNASFHVSMEGCLVLCVKIKHWHTQNNVSLPPFT